jgi:hypothetical protein
MKKSFMQLFVLFFGMLGNLSTRSSFNDNFNSKAYGPSPHKPLSEGTSLNWSGYAALTSLTNPTKSSVNDVSGYWTVPALSRSTENSYTAIWVGIDGYSNGTVEQIGTEQDWTSRGQQNYAWFEMYPAGAYEILGFPVDINDQMAAEVKYHGNNIFQLSIINYTKDVYFLVPFSYTTAPNAQRTSAEWIVEAPASGSTGQVLPLADFGTVLFYNCRATINGYSGSINNSHWTYDALTMVTTNHIIKSLPSNLSNGGQNFSLAWKHQ